MADVDVRKIIPAVGHRSTFVRDSFNVKQLFALASGRFQQHCPKKLDLYRDSGSCVAISAPYNSAFVPAMD
eukprot:scaffold248751_cov36-Prasinocladus_malaysianus.AAC.1